MGANSHSSLQSDRCVALHDILEQLIRLPGRQAEPLKKADLACLTKDAQAAQTQLKALHLQQLEVLEAFEALLAMLNMAPETPLRSTGMMCLLSPLVERLRISVYAFNSTAY